jgi:hypothetical protein
MMFFWGAGMMLLMVLIALFLIFVPILVALLVMRARSMGPGQQQDPNGSGTVSGGAR